MSIYLVLEVGRAPAAAEPQLEGPRASRTTPEPRTDSDEVAPPPRAVIPRPTRAPVTTEPRVTEPITPTPAVDEDLSNRPNPKLDALMSEANKAYDRGDFDEAKGLAQKVLSRVPDNVRMLRILVSADCITGDTAEAQANYLRLPVADRAQMRTRCDRYGVDLKE